MDPCNIDASIGIESLPNISAYEYAPAWPRILGVDRFEATAEVAANLVDAAAAIIKVTAWSNGCYGTRTWDTTSIPVEVPEPGQVFEDKTNLNGFSYLPTYNCASLPHFAIGLPTLHTLEAPVDWAYTETGPGDLAIIRLLARGLDPAVEGIAEGHWMIGLGAARDVVFDSAEALDVLGADEPVALHVNGGEGPLLISRASAVVEAYANQYNSEMTAYRATPVNYDRITT